MTSNNFLSEGFSSFGPQEIYTNKEIELGLQYFEKYFPHSKMVLLIQTKMIVILIQDLDLVIN